MKEKKHSKAVFPIQLLEDVDKLNLSRNERDKVISFLVAIKKKSLDLNDRHDALVGMPCNFLKRNFGEKYKSDYILLLLNNKIIEVCNSYSYGNSNVEYNYCKRYRINKKYYSLIYMCSDFDVKYCKSTNYRFQIGINEVFDNSQNSSAKVVDISLKILAKDGVKDNIKIIRKRKSIKAEVPDIIVDKSSEKPFELDLKLLKIDFAKLRSIVGVNIENSLSKIKYYLNNEITTTYFNSVYMFNGEKDFTYNKKENTKYEMRLSVAKQKAIKYNLDLIEYRGKLYIMKEECFLNMRKNARIDACNDGINELESRAFRAVRSNKNGRLNNNLTNLPTFLTEEIMRQNNLVQLDLANSQFTIFAHLFKNELSQYEDFTIFAKHAQEGNLYELIQSSLGLKSRAESKQTMFELMFSRVNLKSPLKAKLKEIFPNVVKAIDIYKKENGYNMFAVKLQIAESEIFIDGILTDAQNKKMFCLTKHDSIIVRKRDLDKAKKIVENYFNKIGFVGTIKQD